MMLRKHEANSQVNNNVEARSQQNHFTTLKSHPRTYALPKISSTSTEHPPLGEHLWGTATAFQKNFKRLKL